MSRDVRCGGDERQWKWSQRDMPPRSGTAPESRPALTSRIRRSWCLSGWFELTDEAPAHSEMCVHLSAGTAFLVHPASSSRVVAATCTVGLPGPDGRVLGS